MKTVVILMGPKGAGKSTIGDLLETGLGIPFLRVEPLFLAARAEGESERRGFEIVFDALREALLRHDTICFETTGASEHVPWLLSNLAGLAMTLPVRVLADREQCLDRIHARDASLHIPVSDDDILRINAAAAQVEIPWAAEIDNRGAFDREAVLSTIGVLLARTAGTR